MAEMILLEIPEDVARLAREAAEETGRSMELVLTQWLQWAAATTVDELVPGASYPIYSAFDSYEAAQVLEQVLKASNSADTTTDPQS